MARTVSPEQMPVHAAVRLSVNLRGNIAGLYLWLLNNHPKTFALWSDTCDKSIMMEFDICRCGIVQIQLWEDA